MVKIEKKVLLEGLKSVIRVVPRNSSMNILQGVLVECSNNIISITATDLNMAITSNLICQTDMFDENYIVDAKLFHDIINKMPTGEIEISLTDEGKKLKIKDETGKSKFNISTLTDPSQFPDFKAKIENTESILVPGDIFRELVKKTVPFSTEDETRPILMGVLFEFSENQLKGVSLDGYRLAHYVEEIDNDIEKRLVIQSDVLVNIARISGENVKISFDKEETKNIKLETENTIIYTRVLEGQFLNYKEILKPDNVKTSLKINTGEFKKAIERAVIVSKSSSSISPIILSMNAETNKMKISSKSEIATIKEEIYTEIEGEDVKIAFNPQFLLEGLKAIEIEEMELRLNGTLNPAFIIEEEYTYMILPIRLANMEEDDEIKEKAS